MGKAIVFLVFLSVIFLQLFSLVYPQKAKADIATGLDWIGLFSVYTTGTFTNEITDALGYVYPGTCTQTAGAPALAANCNFNTNSLTPGAYEFRLNINGTGAMLAQSKVVWKDLIVNATPYDCNYDPRIEINWAPAPVGVTSVEVWRNDGAGNIRVSPPNLPVTPSNFTNSPVVPDTSYTYTLRAYTSRGVTRDFVVPGSVTCSTVPFSDPWLEVNEGDVHSNDTINLRPAR